MCAARRGASGQALLTHVYMARAAAVDAHIYTSCARACACARRAIDREASHAVQRARYPICLCNTQPHLAGAAPPRTRDPGSAAHDADFTVENAGAILGSLAAAHVRLTCTCTVAGQGCSNNSRGLPATSLPPGRPKMVEAAARVLQQSLSKLGTGPTGRGPDYISSEVQVRSDDVGGRGIYATRDLSEGEELLRISHSALVTAAVGQSYPAGRLLKQVADDVEAGVDWPPGVVVNAFPGEDAPDFPNEETYVVLALVLEDAMRRHATAASDASVQAALANDSKRQLQTELTLDQARRQLYYAALPTVEELHKSHPLFMVSDLEPELEQPASVQAAKRSVLPPIPPAVRTAVARCGLALVAGPADIGAAEAVTEYWSAVVSMHQAVVSEYYTLCGILGSGFATSHSAEEWLYCWTMVMSRNFLIQVGDPALGGAFASSSTSNSKEVF